MRLLKPCTATHYSVHPRSEASSSVCRPERSSYPDLPVVVDSESVPSFAQSCKWPVVRHSNRQAYTAGSIRWLCKNCNSCKAVGSNRSSLLRKDCLWIEDTPDPSPPEIGRCRGGLPCSGSRC